MSSARTRPVCTSPSTSSDSSPMNSPATHSMAVAPDLDRHRAVLEDEQARAFLTGVDQDVARLDFERRGDVRDVRQCEVVEIGEQRLTPQRIDEFRIPQATAAMYRSAVSGVVGIVLGAGGSTRFGRPKQTLPFGDRTLLEHDRRRGATERSGARPVVVVVPARASGVRRRARRGGRERRLERGLLHVRCTRGSTGRSPMRSRATLLLGDMPGVGPELIDEVAAQLAGGAVVGRGDELRRRHRASVRVLGGRVRDVARAPRGQGDLEDRGSRVAGPSRAHRGRHGARSARRRHLGRLRRRLSGFRRAGRGCGRAGTGVASSHRRRAGGVTVFPSPFDYVSAGSVEEAIAAKAEGGDDTRFLAGGQSLLPMMKMRLATPAKLVDINRIPGLDALERVNGHLRVGALVRHADIVALRPHLRRRRVGGAVDLRSARAQPRHAVRVGRPLRSRGRLELGAARHRRRRRRPRAAAASGRSRSPSSSSTSSPTRSPTTRWSPRCASRCRPDASGGSYQKLERKVGDYATVAVAAHLELGRRRHDRAGGRRAHRGRRR